MTASENEVADELELDETDPSLDDQDALGEDEFDEDVDLDADEEPELEDEFAEDDAVDGDEPDVTDPALLATFDGDDEDEPVVALVEDDDDDGDGDGVREGEFVCRSCFMAMRMSALADPKAMLCRDCA